MSSPTKPSVLIVGATGRTGQSIANALLRAGDANVVAAVRPSSAQKPQVQQLAKDGVEIRQADIATDSHEQLIHLLNGINVLIITVQIETDQKPILRAAKEVKSIQRVIPSDWATVTPAGVHDLQNVKFGIRQFIQELGLPYTFIQVGWWLELSFPSRHENKDHQFGQMLNVAVMTEKPILITALVHIGDFVKRIIADPRTLNATVTTWDYISNSKETWDIASKITGESFSDYPSLTADQVEELINTASSPHVKVWYQYLRSLYIRGDNTLENAKAEGSLDTRELYPDYQPSLSLEAAAKAYVFDVPFPPFSVG